MIAMSKKLDWFRRESQNGWFFVAFFASCARAGQASETVPVPNSDKATTRTITNYVNNKSNEKQFTPYKPQGKEKRVLIRVYR